MCSVHTVFIPACQREVGRALHIARMWSMWPKGSEVVTAYLKSENVALEGVQQGGPMTW